MFHKMSCGVPGKDGSKVTTVVATPGQGPDRPQEVSYADMKLIGNGSFGVVYQAKLCDTGELIAIKKVLQDKRFKVRYTLTNSCSNKLQLRRPVFNKVRPAKDRCPLFIQNH